MVDNTSLSDLSSHNQGGVDFVCAVIFTADNRKLGYVPEKDNLVFSRLMDAGKRLSAKIKKIEKRGTFTQIGIGIYLVDF